ncbi:MAG: hypothetical protein DWQ07_25535 [Chloroflexi bacterium]|nr:MAG: hypothetical protein DWQ07_25535 [Chloroflexota bacterium]MBL1197180.1 hypothetical protein [Chloroflexota bacterium]NOH14475.1 hypothetical protein [Chloroflexota bacterium]
MKIFENSKEFFINHKTLFTHLTIPLLTLATIIIILTQPFDLDSLLQNLASDFIIIVITVWYVDWAIKSSEERKWEDAEQYISKEFGSFSHGYITFIVEHLNLSDDVYPPSIASKSPKELQQEIIENVSNLETSKLIQILKSFDKKQWEQLANGITKKSDEALSLLSNYSSRLDSKEMTALLEFREALSMLLASYSIFSPILGRPQKAFNRAKDEAAIEYAAIQTIRTGLDISESITQAINVISTFRFEAQESRKDYLEEANKYWHEYW